MYLYGKVYVCKVLDELPMSINAFGSIKAVKGSLLWGIKCN